MIPRMLGFVVGLSMLVSNGVFAEQKRDDAPNGPEIMSARCVAQHNGNAAMYAVVIRKSGERVVCSPNEFEIVYTDIVPDCLRKESYAEWGMRVAKKNAGGLWFPVICGSALVTNAVSHEKLPDAVRPVVDLVTRIVFRISLLGTACTMLVFYEEILEGRGYVPKEDV